MWDCSSLTKQNQDILLGVDKGTILKYYSVLVTSYHTDIYSFQTAVVLLRLSGIGRK